MVHGLAAIQVTLELLVLPLGEFIFDCTKTLAGVLGQEVRQETIYIICTESLFSSQLGLGLGLTCLELHHKHKIGLDALCSVELARDRWIPACETESTPLCNFCQLT